MAENTNILEINGLHKNFFIRGQKFEVLAGVERIEIDENHSGLRAASSASWAR